MGMSLSNGHGGSLGFNHFLWSKILTLALDHGWEPLGTKPSVALAHEYPDIAHTDETWDGNYTSNDLQEVTAQDALNIAKALERSLEDFPERIKIPPKSDWDSESGTLLVAREEAEKMNPLEVFAGGGKKYVQDFVNFCRQGGFTIS